jgi:hypothetical protein
MIPLEDWAEANIGEMLSKVNANEVPKIRKIARDLVLFIIPSEGTECS